MAQCEVFDAHTLSIPELPPLPRIRIHSEFFLSQNYFTYERAIMYFTKGVQSEKPNRLINIGYNCYMNSVIQCLSFTPGFSQFCLSLPNAMYQHNSEKSFFLDSFAHIFSELENNNSVCPDWLLADSSIISDTFRLPVQQYAHEFLIKLLDTFNKECIKSILCDNDELVDTMISYYFSGDIMSKVQCENCGYSIRNKTRFNDIGIPIHEYKDTQEAVDDITSPTTIDFEGKCQHCGSTHLKQTKHFERFTLVLILTQLRFDNSCKKLEEFLNFPEIINADEGRIQYRLYAMIVHEGRLINHGHYIAYVRNEEGTWYKTDDTLIYKVKDEVVMNSCPYVMFYHQINL